MANRLVWFVVAVLLAGSGVVGYWLFQRGQGPRPERATLVWNAAAYSPASVAD